MNQYNTVRPIKSLLKNEELVSHKGIITEKCPNGMRRDIKTGVCIPKMSLKLRAKRLNSPKIVNKNEEKAKIIREKIKNGNFYKKK